MKDLLNFLLKNLGPQGAQLVELYLVTVAKEQGESAIERALHIPEATLQQLCSKSGADFATAKSMQDASVKAEADFLMYVATGVTS